MRSQITEDTKTPERNTTSGFFTWVKDVSSVVTAMVLVAGAVGSAAWFVDSKVEAMRGEFARAISTTNAELAALRNQIGTDNKGTESRATALDGKIGKNGERIAGMEGELKGTTARLDDLNLRLVGTPDVETEGTPD